jgi:hypothetical protein
MCPRPLGYKRTGLQSGDRLSFHYTTFFESIPRVLPNDVVAVSHKASYRIEKLSHRCNTSLNVR